MRTLAAQVTAITLLCAGAAAAADMRVPVKAPAPAPVASYNWTGCYLGGGGGYGMYDQDTQLFTAAGAPINSSLDQGGRGWFGTVQVGCDIQVGGSFVIGAFADYDWSGIRGNHTGGDGSVGLQSGRVKLDNSWAAGGRIGYLVTPSLLGFFSAGYTQAEFTGTTFFFPGGVADNSATPGSRLAATLSVVAPNMRSRGFRSADCSGSPSTALPTMAPRHLRNSFRRRDCRTATPNGTILSSRPSAPNWSGASTLVVAAAPTD